MTNRIKVFSGFMSASVGFEYAEQQGFDVVLGNELNPIRAAWSRDKHPKAEIVQGSFTDPKIFSYLVRRSKEEKIDLACFSPNCQPFSKAGKQHLHSPEAFLFLYILKYIELTKVPAAWIENAEEFCKAVLADDPRTVEQRIRDALEPLGYHIEAKIQDSAGFLTPQHRRRTIILISRIGIWKHPIECEEKDYITNPKKSGYMGYHMVIETMIQYEEDIIPIKVEIQIRTLAMDFWASAEHKMKYKTKAKLSNKDSKKLAWYAKIINKIDESMMRIYQKQMAK